MEKADLGKHCVLLHKPGFLQMMLHIIILFIYRMNIAIKRTTNKQLGHIFYYSSCTDL